MLVILTKTYLGHSFQLTSNLPDLTHVMSGRKKAFGKGSGNDRFEWNYQVKTSQARLINYES